MFELLKELVIDENVKRVKNLTEQLPANDTLLLHYLTNKKASQLADGEITKDKAISFAIKKIVRECQKQLEKEIYKINTIERAENISSIKILVEWENSSIYGKNATALVFTQYVGYARGHASGYGYDKESAAIAEALNKNFSILKILYTLKEEALKKNFEISSHDACGYGAGYGALPYFEGGVGVQCFFNILSKAGFHMQGIDGDNSNAYILNREI